MNDVTHSTQARDAGAVAAVARRRRSLPSGLWGMAIFLATEAALFGSLIGSYFYLRFTSTQWPQGGIDAPSVALPLALTAVLVLTSVPMFLATKPHAAPTRPRRPAFTARNIGTEVSKIGRASCRERV